MTLKRISLSLLLILIAIPVSAAIGDPPRYVELTFVTTNDIHSRLQSYDVPDPARGASNVKSVGGSARRATIIRRVRAEMRTPVILTDSGDVTYRNSHIGRGYQGHADMAVMNAIGYDAVVLGNHDFEWTGPRLFSMIGRAGFPIVCANLVCVRTGETLLPPYAIREIGGVRVAFFGLMTSEGEKNPSLYVAYPELGLKTLPAAEVASELVPELRQKADIVVLLSHLGTGAETQLAQTVPGIDIILGGHSHTPLWAPRMVSVGQRTAFSLGTVPVVQAGAYGEHVGRTRVVFRRDPDTGRYTLMSCKGRLIPVDGSIPDNPEIKGIIDKLEAARKTQEAKEVSR